MARFDFFLCKFDNKDGVFRHKSHQHHKTYLEIDITVISEYEDPDESSQGRHRHRKQHGQRDRPALILGGEEQEHEQQGKAEDETGLTAFLLFLIGKPAPLHSYIGRQMLVRYVLEDGHGNSRADPLCGGTGDGGRVEHVESLNRTRPRSI